MKDREVPVPRSARDGKLGAELVAGWSMQKGFKTRQAPFDFWNSQGSWESLGWSEVK